MNAEPVYQIDFRYAEPVPPTARVCRVCGFIENDPTPKRCDLCQTPFDLSKIRLVCRRPRRSGYIKHKGAA